MDRDTIIRLASLPRGLGVSNDDLDRPTEQLCQQLVDEGVLTVTETKTGWVFKAVTK